jgi:hypothetical protein
MVQAWTGAPGLGGALLTLLQRLPRVRHVTVTLGARGSATVERLPLPQGQPDFAVCIWMKRRFPYPPKPENCGLMTDVRDI